MYVWKQTFHLLKIRISKSCYDVKPPTYFLCEDKQIGRSSNLHYIVYLQSNIKIVNNTNENLYRNPCRVFDF